MLRVESTPTTVPVPTGPPPYSDGSGALSSPGQRRAAATARWNHKRLAIVMLTIGVLLTLVSCTGNPADAEQGENPTVISYAGAASRLRGLEPAEVQEQLRDWARTGLASHLELDTARLRDAAYDTVPVRDPAFADLSKQSTGPGRALFDGRGVLHVLVPRGDPYEARTVGLLVDQHQADAGADPLQVQIHHYQIRPDAQTIELTPGKPVSTSEVRSAHGFVTMRVDDTKGLTDFVARTRHLSWLEVRGSELWAGGWNWPTVPAAPLDIEDVSVIQRGYLQPAAESSPGFSLDPGPAQTRDDILAVLPGLRPDLADRLISHDWRGSSFQSADGLEPVVKGALFDHNPAPAALARVGLPSDRTQLWALRNLLAGQPTYSQARYDGRLAGTKVGMTLFYTDHVAKDWAHSGVGTGVPTRAVEGFVSNPVVVTPWSHCPGAETPDLEHGRLWFGQNDSAFAFDGDRVSIGAQATRLFSRSEDNGGTEVEPSFSFGRGMRWWDQHYQAVADYEPQYQRLDQIMRWSGALEWLVSKTQTSLPQLDDAAIRSDLRFKDWYAQHSELKERLQIKFVTPPSATQEAVLTKPSEVSQFCGSLQIYGGVSLGDVIQRKGDRSFDTDLPGSVSRAGLVDETSRFDPATGSGQIKQVSIAGTGNVVDSVQRTLSTTADGGAVVDVVASGRRVAPFGGLKVWRAETAPRQLKVEIAADRGQISQRVTLQGQELGNLVARKYVDKDVDTVTIQWRPGLVDRVRRVLESVQDRLVSQPSAELPLVKDAVLYSYLDGSGRVLDKVGGPGAPWLEITKGLRSPGDELVFRLGAPDPRTGQPQFFQGSLSPRPELPPVDGASPQWIEVTPATGDRSAQVRPTGPPGPDARTVPVATPDGRNSTISQIGDRVRVRIDDPILGLDGTAEGAALLRDFRPIDEATRAAAQTNDGLLRGIPLGKDGADGVALVGADRVTFAAADHLWADRVLRAIGPDPSLPVPLFRIEGGRLLHVDGARLTVLSERRMIRDEVPNTASGGVYFHRSMITVENGVIVADALPRDIAVIVRKAVVTDRPSAESTVAQPDIRLHEGGEWWRLPDSGIGTGSGSAATPSPTPISPGVVPVPSGQILLVCPASAGNSRGCEE